jgi:hypothetical protein
MVSILSSESTLIRAVVQTRARLAPTTILGGTSVNLAVALARAPGDGMAGRGLTLEDLCKLLPEADPKAVDDAAFELNALGLVDIQRAIGKQWWLRLNQKFYEQVDYQVMGWESTTEDDARIGRSAFRR